MKAFLILADGTVFEGSSIGATGSTIGETVFTTGMTGYLETLTDPSYYGQIVTQTFPLIGNYGVIPDDYESLKSWVRGYVVRELCDQPSNFRCSDQLNNFLKAQDIIGICGIDTRALTKRLRESGVMNGMIVSGKSAENLRPEELLEKIRDYKIEKAVESVQSNSVIPRLDRGICTALSGKDCPVKPDNDIKSKSDNDIKSKSDNDIKSKTDNDIKSKPDNDANVSSAHHVVLFDFGAKLNIQRELEKRGCKVTVVPYNTTAEEVRKMSPDGIMLSNGPGDPVENTGVIEEIRKLCDYGKIPIFGICLGHQMLALARGCKTSKLKYGHRGGNHPCKDTETGHVYITSQNHGYAVETSSLPDFAKLSFTNVNDNTCEGITYTDIPAFSVQFHPEACGGPHDTNFLFNNFFKLMEAHDALK